MNKNHIQNKKNKFSFALFCVWTVVLLSRPQDYFPFLAPVRPALVLGLLNLIVIFSKKVRSLDRKLFRSRQVKLYIALICVMVLGIPLAIYRRAAFQFIFLGYINVILFFFIFLMAVNTTKKLEKILFIGCLGTGLYLGFALMEGGFTAKRLVFGGMFDPNDLSFFSLSMLPFNLIFISKDNSLLKRFVCMGIFIIGVLVILFTGSRGGFIGFSIVFLMLFLEKTYTFRLPYKIVFITLIFIYIFTKIGTIDFERYRTITDYQKDYNITDETGRMQIWKTGMKLMLQRPFTGVGVSCFAEAIGEDRKERNLPPLWQAAHNSLVQIGAETGVMGLILFSLMSFKAFRIFGHVRKEARSQVLIKIGEMARVGFLGHLISGMFLSQAYSIYWAFYIAISAVLWRFLETELSIKPHIASLPSWKWSVPPYDKTRNRREHHGQTSLTLHPKGESLQ
jgi:O-antigen ligase